jgi:hypothetical protein
VGDPLAETSQAGLERILLEASLGIAVKQPRQPLPPLATLALDGGKSGALGTCIGLPPAPVCRRQPRGVGQQRPAFLPHRQLQQIRAPVGMVPDPRAPNAVRISAQTPVIGRRPGGPLAGTGAEALPIGGIAPRWTRPQAWQPRQRAAPRWPGVALMIPPRLLNGCAPRRFHAGRHRPAAPCLRRDIRGRDGTPGRQGALAGLADGRHPHGGRIFQPPPHRAPIPDRFPGAGQLTRLGQTSPDLATGQAVAADPRKHLADHPRFVGPPCIACLPMPRIVRPIAGAIGGPTAHLHGASPGGMELTAPVALHHRGARILRHQALHLQPQLVCWALPPRPVPEEELHPGALARLHQPPVVGVCARQPLRGVDLEPVHGASRGQIAPALHDTLRR